MDGVQLFLIKAQPCSRLSPADTNALSVIVLSHFYPFTLSCFTNYHCYKNENGITAYK